MSAKSHSPKADHIRKVIQSFGCLALLLMVISGCGKSYPAVSGHVTLDGKPLADVQVLFMPTSTKENPFPGPVAEGKTDSEGRYSLVTTSGAPGGTPGPNVVEFYLANAIELDFLESQAEQLKAGNVGSSVSEQELQSKIESLKSLSSGDNLKAGASTEFTVPSEGTESADFELSDLIKK